jgi:hypothetical protein
MKRLPRLSKSGVLTPPQWDAVARVIEDNFREATIQPGVGYTVKNSSGGASLEIKSRGYGQSARLPFDLVVGTNSTGGSTITVVPGVVAGFLPSNIFSPISYSSGDLYVWAEITSSNGNITGVTLSSGTTTPSPQTASANYPPASLKILLGMIDADGNSFNFIGANWLTPYPVPAFSSTGSNYYIWRW